jgi:hemerythrin
MELCEYPEFDRHKGVHQLFINVLTQYKSEYQQGELAAGELLAFLREWLNVHILGTDKVAASFCKDKKDLIQKALKT